MVVFLSTDGFDDASCDATGEVGGVDGGGGVTGEFWPLVGAGCCLGFS